METCSIDVLLKPVLDCLNQDRNTIYCGKKKKKKSFLDISPLSLAIKLPLQYMFGLCPHLCYFVSNKETLTLNNDTGFIK